MTSWARGLAGLAWETPQCALGAAVFVAHALRGTATRVHLDRGCVFTLVPIGAVSLGRFVFYSVDDTPFVPVGPENIDHEYGHAVQSRRLGPLYLPVVGVTSVLRVGYAIAYRTLRGRRWAGYYDGFPEDQADALGHVDRTKRPSP